MRSGRTCPSGRVISPGRMSVPECGRPTTTLLPGSRVISARRLRALWMRSGGCCMTGLRSTRSMNFQASDERLGIPMAGPPHRIETGTRYLRPRTSGALAVPGPASAPEVRGDRDNDAVSETEAPRPVGVARRAAAAAATLSANRRWWDAEADAYHAEHGAFRGDADFVWCPERLREADVHLLGEVRGTDVLEIGCGAAMCSR